jgi:metal-responsive CopG/Arc/MetJ family transcriptional regulator
MEALKMNTQKVAITIPTDLVIMIDDISKQRGLSRSKYISTVLREKILSEKEREIKESFNRVFSDDAIKKEQLQTAIWFDGTGNQGGQEW